MLRAPFSWPKVPDKYLYHYTSAETALSKIIPSRELRAGSFLSMNDPRESKTWLFAPEYSADPGEQASLLRAASEAAKLAQASTRVIAFSMDDPTQADEGPFECQHGRGFAHSAMWAHYARQHTGVCLIFDRLRIAESIAASTRLVGNATSKGWVLSDKVEYRNRLAGAVASPAADPFLFKSRSERELHKEVLSHVYSFRDELFFRKSKDWQYEREYRWIFWDEGTEPLFVSFSDALVGIVVGEDFGKLAASEGLARLGYFEALRLCCRDRGIKAYVLFWDNGIPRLGALKPLRKWPRFGGVAAADARKS